MYWVCLQSLMSKGVNAQEATTRVCVRACLVKLSFRKINGNRRKCAHRTRACDKRQNF